MAATAAELEEALQEVARRGARIDALTCEVAWYRWAPPPRPPPWPARPLSAPTPVAAAAAAAPTFGLVPTSCSSGSLRRGMPARLQVREHIDAKQTAGAAVCGAARGVHGSVTSPGYGPLKKPKMQQACLRTGIGLTPTGSSCSPSRSQPQPPRPSSSSSSSWRPWPGALPAPLRRSPAALQLAALCRCLQVLGHPLCSALSRIRSRLL